jgi:hypothetical protein
MGKQVRLLLDPGREDTGSDGAGNTGGAPTSDLPRSVGEMVVRLAVFGAGTSAAVKDAAKPAEIEFFSRFVETARKDADGETTSLGVLAGKLKLSKAQPVFECDPESLKAMNEAFFDAVDATADDKPAPRRALKLVLSNTDFRGVDPLADPVRLLLPADPDRHSHLEVLAELKVGGAVEAAREVNDVLDVPLLGNRDFPLPQQKPETLADVGEPQPILLASADPSFLPGAGSIRDKIKQQNEARGKDDSAPSSPAGDRVPFRVVDKATRPAFKLDHGFLDDGAGGIDESKKRSPNASDVKLLAKWRLLLNAAEVARPDLIDATIAYRHFLSASGADLPFSYERFARTDKTGAQIVANVLDDVRVAAAELDDPRGGSRRFVMQTGVIPIGALDEKGKPINPRYLYPGTENWQKAIGAHAVWVEADVTSATDPKTLSRTFVVSMTLHAEDRYNFNPDNVDIATGTPDAENGQFELCGFGKEYVRLATLKRTLKFSLPNGPLPPDGKPPDLEISPPARN